MERVQVHTSLTRRKLSEVLKQADCHAGAQLRALSDHMLCVLMNAGAYINAHSRRST
jgi:hypothetical protein